MPNRKTTDFIHSHRDDDVRILALQAARHPEVDMPYALRQISGRQTARHKLPSWAALDGILYPPHISMEQCSGEQAARYKARLCGRLSGRRSLFIDLTGGFGVDFSFMSAGFARAVYVERRENLCDYARNNFALLGLANAEVVCGDGVDYLRSVSCADVIYLDPSRRNGNGARTYGIGDCTPDVLAIERELLDSSAAVILKLSPMLDIAKTISDLESRGLSGAVREVHVVSVANECKELLVVLSKGSAGPPAVYCVNILKDGRSCSGDGNSYGMASMPETDIISYTYGGGDMRQCGSGGTPAAVSSLLSSPSASPLSGTDAAASLFLYEPNSSIMKAGCFAVLCGRYGVESVGGNSHLFVSSVKVDGFPGRGFQVVAVTSMNRKELRASLAGITKANITVRNFPMSADGLRRRLRLSDGGDIYIFATTIDGSRHVLFVTRKI